MPLINYVVLGELVAELDALADGAVPDAAVRRRREDALYTVCVYTGVRDPLRALVRARRLLARHDAAVLAAELASGGKIEHALANYARRRKPRVEAVMRISRSAGEEGQRAGALACWLRDRRIEREGRDVEKAQAELERLLAFSG